MVSRQIRDERNNGTVAGLSHVLLIICQGQMIAGNDFSNTRRMLGRAVSQFPDLYIIFVANSERLVEDLLYGTNSYGEQRNVQYFLIREHSIDIVRFEERLLNILQPLPRRIVAPHCKDNRSHHNGDQPIKCVNVN